MKNLLFFPAIAMLFLNSSCRNDDDVMSVLPQDPEVNTTKLYTLLTPGNYWVYQGYEDNSDGLFVPTNIDSSYVEKDTLINGKNYSKIVETEFNKENVYFYRDSASYMVDEMGEKVFSNENFGELLYSKDLNFLKMNFYMVGEQISDFEIGENASLVREAVLDFEDPSNWPACGLRPSKWFVKNIGMVRSEIHYVGSCKRVRRELIRYSVQ